ncbi:hypothetical protein [Cohnella yongneupensis]|uniref:Uncharacterized protein n=1 Tax=Cohnella yongneupensis TaxID=425006 RepID=A0ABW0R3E5_9BACL
MAKQKRGHSLWNLPTRGRGTCPICGATRIKLLYPRTPTGSRKTIQVCKRCSVAPQSKIDAVV